MPKFSPEYRLTNYYKWYKAGKPTAAKMLLQMDANDDGDLPGRHALHDWIKQWEIDCQEMDDKIRQQLERGTVAEKVAMYQKLSDQAKELGQKAYGWLLEHPDELTANTAMKLWIEASKIERDVAGVSDALLKMVAMDDQKLLDTISESISNASPELLKDVI